MESPFLRLSLPPSQSSGHAGRLILRWPEAMVRLATDTQVFMPRGTHWPVVGAVATGLLFWVLSMVLCKSQAMRSNGVSRFAGLKAMAWTAFTALVVL